MNRKQRRAEQKQGKANSAVSPVLSEALALHQSGRLEEAERLYRQALASEPRNPDALQLYGVLACQSARPELGVDLITRAIAVNPGPAGFHLNLGNAFQALGKHDDAARSYRRALSREPRNVVALNKLGSALLELGAPEEALARATEALALQPGYAEAHFHQGAALQALGRNEAAAAAYRRALDAQPGYPAALNNLGTVLQTLGRPEEAIDCLSRAIADRPDFAAALSNLGNVLQAERRLDEAVDHYRRALAVDPSLVETYYNFAAALRLLGQLDQAIGCYRQALSLAPEELRILNALGVALRDRRMLDESIEICARAVALAPMAAASHDNLARSLQAAGRLSEAIESYQRCLELDPTLLGTESNLADALSEQGHVEEAVARHRALVARSPEDAVARDKLLFIAQYLPDATEQTLLEEARAWGDRHAPSLPRDSARFDNDRDPGRRLRIGYLSGDFKLHACAFFVHPLFAHHDRSAVELFAYSEDEAPDGYTDAFREVSDHWRSVHTLDDEALARRIREDRIDILAHLSAHTAGSRLKLAGLRPAPIQATWMGLGTTSGVAAIDYAIADRFLVPDGAESFFSETVIRLPDCAYCYSPPEAPEVAPPPALANGFVTFGTLSRAVRLNDRTLGVWARILAQVPGSRLLINTLAMNDPATTDRLRRFFAARGVGAERLDLICTRGREATLGSYGSIDIALDPFPHNAGLTTYEALHMGAPVVTRADRPPQGRYGASILSNLGFPEWVAGDDDAYVDVAVALASDLDRLSALRAGMRARMTASPLRDAASFARGMEAAYRQMWADWLEDASGSS